MAKIGINELAARTFKNVKALGKYDDPVNLYKILNDIKAEVDEVRDSLINRVDYNHPCISVLDLPVDEFKEYFETFIKGSKEEEIVDTIMSAYHLGHHLKIDMDTMIKIKDKYNEVRDGNKN